MGVDGWAVFPLLRDGNFGHFGADSLSGGGGNGEYDAGAFGDCDRAITGGGGGAGGCRAVGGVADDNAGGGREDFEFDGVVIAAVDELVLED